MPVDPYLEFHRHAVARMPAPEDRHPGVAFFVGGKAGQVFCSCRKTNKDTCSHLKALWKSLEVKGKPLQPVDLNSRFSRSLWHALAETLNQGDPLPMEKATVQFLKNGARTSLEIKTAEGRGLISYLSTDSDRNRLAERLGFFSSPDKEAIPDRAEVLQRLQLLTMSDAERQLHELNMQSRRQGIERSVWYRVAYHGFMTFGENGCDLHPSVDEKTGNFIVTGKSAEDEPIFHIRIARKRVRALLTCLGKHLHNQHDLPIHPIPLKSLFRVSRNTETDLDVRPVIKMIQEEGEERFFSREDLEKFIYDDLVYIPELKILAELEKPGQSRQFQTPRRMTFKKYQIPNFLETYGEQLAGDGFLVDPEVKGLKLLKKWNTLKLTPGDIDRDWCWLSMSYGFGDESVSLSDILSARREGNRYINTADGWVDTHSPVMDALTAITDTLPEDRFDPDNAAVKLSRQELFRFAALEESLPTVSGTDENAKSLNRLLTLEPTALPEETGLSSDLRDYQKLGLKWLWWLWENRLGGLLCDDMGLGKTHQMMALMALIRKQESPPRPILVICPTSVLSHWATKIGQHAPSLAAAVYHGTDRDLAATLAEANVLVTTYGLLLRDAEKLEAIDFCLAVFDEMQQIKNAVTKTHAAANRIRAAVKIGLSGTPIENSVLELKALMDVVVPGYLDSDESFKNRFMGGATAARDSVVNRAQLRRLIHPFTLRRLKSRVLDELPEKIEDIRYCELTDKQVKLYRDAITSRSAGIIASLKNKGEAIPYIHIFALLTLLKQICNHPAMVEKQAPSDSVEDSGKWELFKELLGESLNSGQKVVVYSQFAQMIAIIDAYLKQQEIDHVVLTGASRNRGCLIERFNTDPQCRVFVGSLKAGGTGIDLVAGSVVIHYDRWWNAAKEDQATDRVHRIGQRRGVQVFKLVTLGTLEEKISTIIEKKRRLMADIVREDDPGLLKAFTRDELLEFLS